MYCFTIDCDLNFFIIAAMFTCRDVRFTGGLELNNFTLEYIADETFTEPGRATIYQARFTFLLTICFGTRQDKKTVVFAD